MNEYSLIHDASELRRLIAENPTLPIVVLADEESACDWSSWTFCSSVKCVVTKLLDVRTPYDNDGEILFTDETEFEEAVGDFWSDAEPDYSGMTLDEKIQSEIEKYKPEWRDVIAIYATN